MVDPGYRRVWRETVRETKAVFHAIKIQQRSPRDKDNIAVKYMDKVLGAPTFLIRLIARAKRMKGGKTSMLQDLEAGAPETEIDYITGWVVQKGKEVNIPTPVSAKLVQLIKEATEKRQGSPYMSPDELLKSVGLDESFNANGCTMM